MLQYNVILTLFAHYLCLHGYIHFIYLFNPNRYVPYTANQGKNTEIWNFAHIAKSYFEETTTYFFSLDSPSCGLRREAKSFFFLTEFMPFKFW